jgi:thiamine-monophosphate kinase
MPDDPDESFVIDTLLRGRRGCSTRPVSAADAGVPLFAPGDDAAMVAKDMAITVDTMVEGVHWDDRMSASDVGWKLVAANASDINAMAGIPTWGLLSIALPAPLDRAWVSDFAQGLGDALSAWTIDLVGGDTTRSTGARMVSLTLAGRVPRPIGRNGAKPGQTLWVSGPLGGPAAGFFSDCPHPDALEALRRPHPPIGLGAALSETGAIGAMMDLSDGLARDLPRLCSASDVGAVVDPSALPPHPGLTIDTAAVSMMTGFGEEYALLFTADPTASTDIIDTCTAHGQQPSPIGIIDTHGTARLSGMDWPTLLFSHFGGEA